MKKAILSIVMVASAAILQAEPPMYSLKSCLETGLEQNYAIRISRNDEQIAQNNATAANAGKLPEVGFVAGYGGDLTSTRTHDRAGGVTDQNGVYDQSVNAGINVDWTIFNGFSIQAEYDRLQELEREGAIQTRITIEDFVATLTAEYYNYIQQRIRLSNYRYAMSLSKERLRIAQLRYSTTRDYSRLDYLQARVYFNADSSQFMNQQELVHTSRIRLNQLMAVSDVDRYFVVQDSVITIDQNLEWNYLEQRMLENNASLLMADREQRLAEIDLKAVQSRNYPYVKMNAGYGYTFNRYGSGTTFKRRNLDLSAGVTVGITIFDGSRKREQRNARIAIENARLTREDLELSLRADLSNFWQAYQNNIEVLKLENDNVATARENYEKALDRYMVGDLAGIEIREAQKSLLDAEERLLTAQYNTKLCEISLYQLCGEVLRYME